MIPPQQQERERPLRVLIPTHAEPQKVFRTGSRIRAQAWLEPLRPLPVPSPIFSSWQWAGATAPPLRPYSSARVLPAAGSWFPSSAVDLKRPAPHWPRGKTLLKPTGSHSEPAPVEGELATPPDWPAQSRWSSPMALPSPVQLLEYSDLRQRSKTKPASRVGPGMAVRHPNAGRPGMRAERPCYFQWAPDKRT